MVNNLHSNNDLFQLLPERYTFPGFANSQSYFKQQWICEFRVPTKAPFQLTIGIREINIEPQKCAQGTDRIVYHRQPEAGGAAVAGCWLTLPELLFRSNRLPM